MCPQCLERVQAGEQASGYAPSWKTARLPREFWERGVDGIRVDAHRKAVADYLAKWPPQKSILLLFGAVGSGKSSAAAAILREVKTRHHRLGRWYSVPSLLARFRATMNDDSNETSQQISSELDLAPLIVLDDLGAEKSTEWAGEQLYIAIDRRYGRMVGGAGVGCAVGARNPEANSPDAAVGLAEIPG
jgi:DNA replication protein DnaC